MLTLDQFQRRGWLLANRCCLCKVKKESIDHNLLQYYTKTVAFHSSWCFLGTVSQSQRNSFNLAGIFVGKRCKKVWRATLLCIFWTTWKERDRRSFNEQSDHALKSCFLDNHFLQVKLYIDVGYAFNEFCWLVGFLLREWSFLCPLFSDVPLWCHVYALCILMCPLSCIDVSTVMVLLKTTILQHGSKMMLLNHE